ncbi:MAG: hypothetical protein QXI39_05665 [Candidatus Bathyarchaeia archaeon]
MNKPFERDRTPRQIIAYAIYLYLSGLSLRKSHRVLVIHEKRLDSSTGLLCVGAYPRLS